MRARLTQKFKTRIFFKKYHEIVKTLSKYHEPIIIIVTDGLIRKKMGDSDASEKASFNHQLMHPCKILTILIPSNKSIRET